MDEELNLSALMQEMAKEIRKPMLEAFFGKTEVEIVRKKQKIRMHRKKEYFHEKRYNMEVFYSGDTFIVTSNFSTDLDLLNLSYTDVSRKSGIYIIFNEENFYVGQTSDGFIRRFKNTISPRVSKKFICSMMVRLYFLVDSEAMMKKAGSWEKISLITSKEN